MGRAARVPFDLKSAPFSLEEARAHGITLSALRGKSWRRVGSSLYQWVGQREDTLRLLQAWHRRLPNAIFMGFTAAWLHHLDVDPSHPIEIAVPRHSEVRSRPGLLVRQRLNLEVAMVRGLPATSPPQTFADLRKRLPPCEYLVLADEALRLGLGRFDELAQPAESPMETRLRWLLISAGLAAPQVQADLYNDAGDFVGRADLYYPGAHVVIEFDGGNHRDRLISDNRRQNAIVSAGYRILRFTTADVIGRPDRVTAEVGLALRGRADR